MTQFPKAVRSTTGVFGRIKELQNDSVHAKGTESVRLFDLVAHGFGLSVTGEFGRKLNR